MNQNTLSVQCKWASGQSRRPRALLWLVETKRVFQHCTFPHAQMPRIQGKGSWSLGMPSKQEHLKCSPHIILKSGGNFLLLQILYISMHIFLMAFILASWAVSPQYLTLISYLIVLCYIHILTPLTPSLNMNTPLDALLDLYLELKWKSSLVRNSILCKTCPSPFDHLGLYLPLICWLIRTYTYAPGGPHQQYAFLFGPFLQAHRQLFVMWQKPIKLFLFTHLNGQGWSSEQENIILPLISASVSVFQHLQELMEKSQMQVLTSYNHRELVQYPNGWITICSSKFSKSISLATTISAKLVLLLLQGIVACLWMRDENGIMDQQCLMAEFRSSGVRQGFIIPNHWPISSIPMLTKRCSLYLLLWWHQLSIKDAQHTLGVGQGHLLFSMCSIHWISLGHCDMVHLNFTEEKEEILGSYSRMENAALPIGGPGAIWEAPTCFLGSPSRSSLSHLSQSYVIHFSRLSTYASFPSQAYRWRPLLVER